MKNKKNTLVSPVYNAFSDKKHELINLTRMKDRERTAMQEQNIHNNHDNNFETKSVFNATIN